MHFTIHKTIKCNMLPRAAQRACNYSHTKINRFSIAFAHNKVNDIMSLYGSINLIKLSPLVIICELFEWACQSENSICDPERGKLGWPLVMQFWNCAGSEEYKCNVRHIPHVLHVSLKHEEYHKIWNIKSQRTTSSGCLEKIWFCKRPWLVSCSKSVNQ